MLLSVSRFILAGNISFYIVGNLIDMLLYQILKLCTKFGTLVHYKGRYSAEYSVSADTNFNRIGRSLIFSMSEYLLFSDSMEHCAPQYLKIVLFKRCYRAKVLNLSKCPIFFREIKNGSCKNSTLPGSSYPDVESKLNLLIFQMMLVRN